MISEFIFYGQWVVLVLSILSIALVSSTKHQTRQGGYIFTAIARLSGAVIFVLTDLFAFAIANFIQIIISLRGFYANKKAHKAQFGAKIKESKPTQGE